MMTETYQLLQRFFTVPGFAFELGLMVAVAMILGFVLYTDWEGVGKWALMLLVFLFFLEWLKSTIITGAGVSHSNAPIVVDIFGSIVFMGGAGAGAYLSWRNKVRRDQIDAEAAKVFSLIKNKKLDQITRPRDVSDRLSKG